MPLSSFSASSSATPEGRSSSAAGSSSSVRRLGPPLRRVLGRNRLELQREVDRRIGKGGDGGERQAQPLMLAGEAQRHREPILLHLQPVVLVLEDDRHLVGILFPQIVRDIHAGVSGGEGHIEMVVARQAVGCRVFQRLAHGRCAARAPPFCRIEADRPPWGETSDAIRGWESRQFGETGATPSGRAGRADEAAGGGGWAPMSDRASLWSDLRFRHARLKGEAGRSVANGAPDPPDRGQPARN